MGKLHHKQRRGARRGATAASGAQVVTHPTALCKREGAINTFFMSFYQGDHQQQGGAPAWRVVSKREAIRSKHGGPGHRGQGVVQGAHGRILKSSGSGRRLGRWSLGATEERRRGRGFLGHVCERESLIQSVMLYLVS